MKDLERERERERGDKWVWKDRSNKKWVWKEKREHFTYVLIYGGTYFSKDLTPSTMEKT